MSTEFPPPALKAAALELATVLKERNETISVAETAAGGLISASLLATPGASKIYKGGAMVSALLRWWSRE
jgi:nicotinamide mononucleotide (NMN) deamidase PncC